MRQAKIRKKRKKDLSTKIAEEMINEIMMAGIAFVIILFGINWFNMKWAWFGVMEQMSTATGFAGTATGAEVTAMLTALGTSFPFKYLFGTFSFTTTLIIAIILTIVGFGAKLWTTRTKGKLIIDIGRNIYVPAIVGILCIVLLQLLAAFHMNNYMSIHAGIMPTISSGLFAWNSYGQLFLIGAALLIVGSIVKLIAEKNKMYKWMIVGNTLFAGSLFLILYYFMIRIISLDLIINSAVGNLLSVFLVSNQISNWTLAFCLYFFVFGWELKKYGVKVLRAERKALHIAHLQQSHRQMEQNYGAKIIRSPKDYPAHPKELAGRKQETGHPVRPAYPSHQGQQTQKAHTSHRYVQPEGHYRTQRTKKKTPGFGDKL